MVIKVSGLMGWKSNRGRQLSRWRGSGTGDARHLNEFLLRNNFTEMPRMRPAFFWNNDVRDELARRVRWLRAGAVSLAKEFTMRNRILAIAAVASALTAPIAAQAQGTVGVTGGGTVVIGEHEGIVTEQRPAFREYVVRERVPNYTIPERVIVGGVLPETGVTYYDVPQTFGATPYRYTVVNGQTVLVEPRSRRIVQVVD
jgi:Protein of unknown function (DUF1236)